MLLRDGRAGRSSALNSFIVDKASVEWGFGCGAEQQQLSEEEKLLLPLLVCSKSLMFSPLELAEELQKKGVTVYRHVQQAGEVVMGKGTCAHCGLVSGGSCAQTAVNTCGVEWLEDGLPQLRDHLLLVVRYLDARTSMLQSNATLHAKLYDRYVEEMIVYHHTPRDLLLDLLTAILEDLNKSEKDRRCNYDRLQQRRSLVSTKALINEVLTLMNDKRIVAIGKRVKKAVAAAVAAAEEAAATSNTP